MTTPATATAEQPIAQKIARQIAQKIADELGVRAQQVTATVELLDGGATVPFIARYRKEATGALDDAQLRKLTRVDWDSLPLELSFKRVKGNGSRKLAIFS